MPRWLAVMLLTTVVCLIPLVFFAAFVLYQLFSPPFYHAWVGSCSAPEGFSGVLALDDTPPDLSRYYRAYTLIDDAEPCVTARVNGVSISAFSSCYEDKAVRLTIYIENQSQTDMVVKADSVRFEFQNDVSDVTATLAPHACAVPPLPVGRPADGILRLPPETAPGDIFVGKGEAQLVQLSFRNGPAIPYVGVLAIRAENPQGNALADCRFRYGFPAPPI